MQNIIIQLETIIAKISALIWPVFLPFILIMGAYLSIKSIFVVKKHRTNPSKLKLKNVIGPAAISLGAMIGTGAIIGVIGALSKLSSHGQSNIEAMAIWALIGACIMVPVSYSETLDSKIMKKIPKEYISDLLSPTLGKMYGVCFVILAVFGFGGFQFSGIDAVSVIAAKKFMEVDLSLTQRYLFIIIPIIIIVALIVLSKKHDLFINSMAYMIGIAVVAYFIFFILFTIKTCSHIPIYIQGMILGIKNPVNAMMGVPLGFILGMQKVIQTAETGLGALAMAAQESDSEPREAAIISLIPTIVTIFVSIVVTSYIASYGMTNGIIVYPADAITRLSQYFDTAISITGTFGLVVLTGFTILSAITTILGSYYYLSILFNDNLNRNIIVYLVLVTIAGTLAVFGVNVVFEAVDLLLFVLSGINISALAVFARLESKNCKSEVLYNKNYL